MVTTDKARIARVVGACVSEVNRRLGAGAEIAQYHANLLNSYLPDGFPDVQAVDEASKSFLSLWEAFGLS
jgi:hypothetical protein